MAEVKVIGTCPHCGADIVPGKFGPYCNKKCGFTCKKAFGKALTEDEVSKLLSGEEILLKGLISKKTNNAYDMYVKPDGVEDFSFTNKDGETITGYSFKFTTRFPESE